VPRRVKELIPDVKLIAFIRNPIDRAYSVFQHEKKNNLMAKNYSFYDILNSNNESDPNMFNLRQRCLIPGLYYEHLSRWLKEFRDLQIYLFSIENFKKEPYLELNNLQKFLGFNTKFNFNQVSEIVEVINNNSTLNKYPKIDQDSFNYLDIFFNEPNKKFKFLVSYTPFFSQSFKIPEWLF
jgi:hypothetical protein